jgi:HD-like signal output (HDOD) protein
MSQQPQNLAGWVAFLQLADIPVLKRTARDLERLRDDEAQLNARNAAKVAADDPLMTVKLLRYLQAHKRSSQTREVVQVEQAILMMGFDTFYRDIPAIPIVEDLLHAHLDAQVHLLHTVRRAQRAAHWAYDWALRLHDLHAEEVFVCTLLAHVTEMLMWCFNTEAMLEIRRRHDADKTLRSRDLQNEILGFVGADLQRALVAEWHLPQLLQDLLDSSHAHATRVRNVTLAVNLARHSATGWDDAALPDDYRDIGELLRIDPERVKVLVGVTPAAQE